MPLSDDDKTFLDLAFKLYSEQATQARQHETLRAQISTGLFGLSGAILGLFQFAAPTSVSGKPSFDAYLVGLLLIVIGCLGVLLSNKHYDRNRFHVARLRAYRRAIDDLLSARGIRKLSPIGSNASDAYEKKHFFWARIVRLHVLWSSAFAIVILIGLLLVVPAFCQNR